MPRIVVVDDRPGPRQDLDPPDSPRLAGVTVLHSGGRGPAAARNVGWRATETDWVAFLDDDVVVSENWLADVVRDLDQPASVAGVQGRITVPLPADRRPTDWERGTAGLETARWITADMAYRGDVLRLVGGFDDRFPRAFREDADLALRVLDAGYGLAQGERQHHASGTPGRVVGEPSPAARQRRRRLDGPAARPGLAAAGRGTVGSTAPSTC